MHQNHYFEGTVQDQLHASNLVESLSMLVVFLEIKLLLRQRNFDIGKVYLRVVFSVLFCNRVSRQAPDKESRPSPYSSFPNSQLVLSSHQPRTFVCLYWSGDTQQQIPLLLAKSALSCNPTAQITLSPTHSHPWVLPKWPQASLVQTL